MWDSITSSLASLGKVIEWFLDEDGYREWQTRRALAHKKKECADALANHDWARLRACVDELERLSHRP